MTPKENMIATVSKMTNSQIVEVWDMLNCLETTEEHYIIRGVMMDELELRNEDMFEQWVESSEDSPRMFFN
jgi:hypothetical protein